MTNSVTKSPKALPASACAATTPPAVAIVPQLFIVYKKREVEIITGSYMAALGCYKVFYVMSWIYQLLNNHPMIWIKFIAGGIQIAIYLDYLYYYFVSAKVSANTIQLPV